MRNRTTTSRGRRKRRGSEIVDLRIVINRKRQAALPTNEHVDNSESSGNKEDAKDISELTSIRPNIDYSDILVSSDDMIKDEGNTDFSGDTCEKNRQSMFVGDELVKISDDKETSDPNVSNCNGNREIPTKKDDGHRSRQVQENELSITSRKYVATKTRKDEHIHEQSDLKSIPLDRVCDSNKDKGSEINREMIGSDEMREEGEIYEDEYVQKQPIKDFSSLRKNDHDAFGFKPKKIRQPEVKEKRGSKQQRDNEAQNVNNSRSHFLQPSTEKEISARNVCHSKGKREMSNKGLVNSDCDRSGQGNVPSITSRNYHHIITEGHKVNENILELGDLKSISSDRVCDTTRIAHDSSDADREKTASSELREEGEIYEDVQTQPKKLIKTIQKRDDDVNAVRSMKRRPTDSKDERRSKRRRDNEAHHVKNRRSHLHHKTNVPDRKRYTDTSDQRSLRPLHRHHERESKNYGRDLYRRNREQSSWECPSRNKSNRSAADHKQKEDTIWESRVSNTRPSATRFGIIPKIRKQISDRKYGQIVQYSFLGTLKYLSRPSLTNDEIANILAMRSDELSQYLRKDEKCPKLSSLIDILVRCAECKVSTTSKRNVMYILRTSKLFGRKDVIDSLIQMRTSPTNSSADDKFIYGLLLVMKAMIDTVNLEENDTTIVRSLIESILNHRRKI